MALLNALNPRDENNGLSLDEKIEMVAKAIFSKYPDKFSVNQIAPWKCKFIPTEDEAIDIETELINSNLFGYEVNDYGDKAIFLVPQSYAILKRFKGSYKDLKEALKKELDEDRAQKDIIHRLEFDKLQNEVYKLQQEIDHLPSDKGRERRNELLTWAAIVISIITLIMQCRKQ